MVHTASYGSVPIICVALVALVVSACSSGNRSKILGKWERVDGGAYFEFFDDGTVSYRVDSPVSLRGKWELLDDGHLLKIDTKVVRGEDTTSASVEFKNGAMFLFWGSAPDEYRRPGR